jgi:signal transduction histidine kinase
MISIDDTGEGMTKEELQHIQKEFATNNHTSKGLGLSICKELIDQMGGTLEINSERGLGTTVWITLPCTATDIKRRKII